MRRELPLNVNPAFQSCAPFLIEAFEGADSFVLGGGTVLASRWSHRVSTDLDFFLYADAALIPRHIKDAGERLADMSHIFEDLVVHTRHLSFVCMGAKASVFSNPPLTHTTISEQETVTALRLDTTDEILAKKLSGRIMGLGEFLIRDLYDICVASHLDGDAYRKALTVLTDGDLDDMASELTNYTSTPTLGREDLINPKYKNLAQNVWGHAQTLFRGRSLPDHLFHVNTVTKKEIGL